LSYTQSLAVEWTLELRAEDVTMADLLYVVMMIALTGIGAAFVIGCDKIVGPDELELVQEPGSRTRTERETEELAA
jgi:hypothetical protein